MRADLEIIQGWIPTDGCALDLGCGDDELLVWLRGRKQANGCGLEIDPGSIARCIENGVNVIEQDLDKDLGNSASDNSDVVVVTQALQVIHYPDRILEEVLRVGKTYIITFPNFDHWRRRWYLARNDRMPVSEFLPYTWCNTPSIHFCTFRDFEHLCHRLRMRTFNHLAIDRGHRHGWASRLQSNLLGEIEAYRIAGPGVQTRNLAVQGYARLRIKVGYSSACSRESTAEVGQGHRQQTINNVHATFQERPPCVTSPLSFLASV